MEARKMEILLFTLEDFEKGAYDCDATLLFQGTYEEAFYSTDNTERGLLIKHLEQSGLFEDLDFKWDGSDGYNFMCEERNVERNNVANWFIYRGKTFVIQFINDYVEED